MNWKGKRVLVTGGGFSYRFPRDGRAGGTRRAGEEGARGRSEIKR